MKPTHRQTKLRWTIQRSFHLFAAVALTAALVACTGDMPDADPTVAPLQTATPVEATPTPPRSPSTQPPIEAVFSWVASRSSGDPLRPLFEHLPADRAVLDRLARALETAKPAAPDEHLWANDRGRYLDVRYRDGTKTAIRQVARCEPWTDADAKESAYVGCKGKLVRQTDTWWVEGTGMVKSSDLAQWWEDMTEFMVRIGNVSIPGTIRAGESFTITLYSWNGVMDAAAMNLSLVSLDGAEIQLGAYPVPDTFQGQLTVPDQTPSGRYWLRVSGGGFSELVKIVHVE